MEKELRWRSLLAGWSKSGLSGPAYCQQQGVIYGQFASWKKVIKQRDAESRKDRVAINRSGAGRPKSDSSADSGRQRSVQFAPVKVTESPKLTAHSALVGAESMLEIVLNGGLVVRVNSGCQLDFLASVISLLETR
jgi:hypothetical protein